MNEIKVSTENVHKAFHAAGENPAIQELLINLFGKENVEPEQSKDATVRPRRSEKGKALRSTEDSELPF